MNDIIKPIFKDHSILRNKKMFTFDTESSKSKNGTIEEQKFYVGCLYSDSESFRFNSEYEFEVILENLLKQYKKLILFAHNIKYDLQVLGLINKFVKDDSFLKMDKESLILGKVNYIKFKRVKSVNNVYSLEFVDSFNYFPYSLRVISKSLGYDKELTIDEYKIDGQEWNNLIKEKGYEMSYTDSKILFEALQFFNQIPNLEMGISASQSSFLTYRRHYQEFNIDLERFNSLRDFIYHGGRVELYNKNPLENADYLDFNSLYPFVMSKYKYSYKWHKSVYQNCDINYIIDNLENYNYIVECSFTDTKRRNGVMQSIDGHFLNLQEGNNVFLTGTELKSLYDDGAKIEIHKFYEFKHTDLFSLYINDIYKFKQESTGMKRDLYKLLLNSLYGKWAQSPDVLVFHKYKNELKYMENFRNSKDRIEFNDKIYTLYHSFLTTTEKMKPKYSIVIGSEITANARIENFNFQKQIGFENVYITDTDSFVYPHFRTEHLTDYINDKILGQLKLEHTQSYFEGYGLKDYYLKDGDKIIRKHKGISKNAVEISKGKYLQKEFKILNKTYDTVLVEDKIKEEHNKIEKLKYENGIGFMFRNYNDFLNQNKRIINEIRNP